MERAGGSGTPAGNGSTATHSTPLLGFSYGGRDPALLERILPFVDVLEVTPDDLIVVESDDVSLDLHIADHLSELSAETTIVVHGIGLTIGSHEGWSQTYIRLLSELLDRVPVAWHSEHLGYTTVDGNFLGTMLNLPRTEEALAMVANRVAAIRSRFGIPFLLENVAGLLPDPGGAYTPAAFLNTLATSTGCGILLDVYNLECDAANTGLDIDAFLGELDISLVGEMHLAAGVERSGLRLDVHSRLTEPSTRALAARVLAQRPDVTALYELLPQAVPVVGRDAIASELHALLDLPRPVGALA
jgi:uncharacterized protein (UPF0276 family)